jgi:1,4-dihydroxy-2-naphthoate octaprenyltransferase
LAAGCLAPRVAWNAGCVCALIAIALITLMAAVEPAAAAIGALALLGSWFYSAPPLALMGSGWGEITASLIVSTHSVIALTGLPLALIHWAMLVAFELPDFDADSAVNKRTQAVRLGRERATRLHNGLLILGFAVIVGLASTWPPARFLAWAGLLAAWQVALVSWSARRGWIGLGWLTFGAVSLFALTALLWMAGFVLS